MKKKKINWMKNPTIQLELLREDKQNIYPNGICDRLLIKAMINYLLGENWYVADPLSSDQINAFVLDTILNNVSKRYRKEISQYKKERKIRIKTLMQHRGISEVDAEKIVDSEIESELKEFVKENQNYAPRRN